MEPAAKISLVLGGGGMRGLAHIGVVKVLARHGIIPGEYIGTSVGSLVAAMAGGGMMPEEIERIALDLRKKDILDYDWWGLFLRRARNRSVYKGKALHDLVRRVLPVDRFDQLVRPVYITSANVHTGAETVWGMPGLDRVPIHDCVVASCSIPGVFPPKQIEGYWFVDGSMVDPLPLRVAVYHGATLIIAVYLDRPAPHRRQDVEGEGFLSIMDRGHALLSRTICANDLRHFKEAPLVLIEPDVEAHGLFKFERTDEVIAAGEAAAEHAVAHHPLLRDLSRPAVSTPLPEAAPMADQPGLVEKPRERGRVRG
jgi:NTE family protein